MARITAADVAREAGVSQSAVSRVFTPGGSFSKETEARVRAAAERLGYRPNRLAQGLITGRTRLVGLVVPGLTDPFRAALADCVGRALAAEGWQPLMVVAGPDGVAPDAVPALLFDYQVEAIVALAGALPDAPAIAAAGVPLVSVDGGAGDGPGAVAVETDGAAAGRMAADLLVAGDHRRFVHVPAQQGGRVARDRAEGFVAGLAAAGKKPWTLIDHDPDPARMLAEVRRLFDRPRKPDALFAGSGALALALLDLVRHDLGLRVPADVSVVGHDDAPIAAAPGYALTTVAQPLEALAARCVAVMDAAIGAGADGAAPVRLPGGLILRGSARLPAAADASRAAGDAG